VCNKMSRFVQRLTNRLIDFINLCETDGVNGNVTLNILSHMDLQFKEARAARQKIQLLPVRLIVIYAKTVFVLILLYSFPALVHSCVKEKSSTEKSSTEKTNTEKKITINCLPEREPLFVFSRRKNDVSGVV